MENYSIYFANQNKTMKASKGTILKDVICEANIWCDYPCGGKGICRKCSVDIVTESGERKTVLSCSYQITSSLQVFLTEEKDLQTITNSPYENLTEKKVDPDKKEIGKNKFNYVAVFDIGTTSLVGYILNKRTKKEEAVASRMNPQRKYGADVISRALYESEKEDGALTLLIQNTLDEMIGELAEKIEIDRIEIGEVMLVGNTCMHHLFLGISPVSLLKPPYQAAMTEAFEGMAQEYHIHIAPAGRLRFLPNLAGFVGADTVGCLLTIDFLHEKRKTLMIDIGTNGELVMGTEKEAYTCSTAAGPALEGAKISCGMCGIPGAIQHVEVNKEELYISVIGNREAVGICGSGLIDAIAVFYREGLIDARGRIQRREQLATNFARKNAWRIKGEKKNAEIILTDQVVVTQQDIREVQLAKGAIAAGIQTLCQRLEWELKDLEQILIAGAFGNYINFNSACDIGLLPTECRNIIHGIGNAAGEGAKIAIQNEEKWEQAKEYSKMIQYVELATEKTFQNSFAKNLNFPG